MHCVCTRKRASVQQQIAVSVVGALTTEQLRKEIERREEEERRTIPDAVSDHLLNPAPLKKFIESGLRDAVRDGPIDDDFEHYVYEAAMEMVYGPSIWDWINKQDWG